MDKEKIKIEIELLKLYSWFIIGLTTGLVTLYLREDFYDNIILLILSISGTIILLYILQILLSTYFRIKKALKS